MKKEKYLKGKENWFIRMNFYVNSGLGIVNNYRNLIFAIFGVYITLKLTSPLWLIGMFILALPVLMVLGYYNIHRMSKINEWLSIKFATHYAIKQFNLNEEQVKLLKDIKNLLTKKRK